MGVGKLSSTWKINGRPIYEPSLDTQIEYTSMSAEGSGRTADAIMHNRFVRSRITKVHIKYPALTRAEVGMILGLVQGKEFDLTYMDLIDGVKTIRCTCAESSGKLYSAVFYDGLCKDVTFNCVEV